MKIANKSYLVTIFLTLSLPLSYSNFSLSCKPNLNKIVEDEFQKEISVSVPFELEINILQGNINITRGNDKEIKISSRFKVLGTKEEEIKLSAEKIKKDPPIDIKNNKIKIGNLKKYNIDGWFSKNKVVIDLDIYAPVKTTVTAETGLGNINVISLGSNVKAKTGLGSIKIENAESADVKTGSGYIKIVGIANDVNIISGKGSIELIMLSGNINAKTGYGDITVNSKINEGKKWILDSGLGNVDLILPSGSTFSFSCFTGLGEINFNINGEIIEKTEKKIEGKVGINPTSTINIKVGKGNISAKESIISFSI
jgi:hypothetical protein